MNDGAIIGGLVSAVALVVSLLFLARQTRESARQSHLANQIAGSQAKSDIYRTVDRILFRFLEYPYLRKYFYEDEELPEVSFESDSGELRQRVLTFAELFADVIERGLDTYRSVDPASDFKSPMEDYARDMLTTSSAIRYLVHEHPGWWPNVESWLSETGTAWQDGGVSPLG
jgi:hypothetical protein